MVKFKPFFEVRKTFKLCQGYFEESVIGIFSKWNYFRKIFRFRDFMNAFMIFENILQPIESQNLNSSKKQVIYLRFQGSLL